jgi:hypothetical protein
MDVFKSFGNLAWRVDLNKSYRLFGDGSSPAANSGCQKRRHKSAEGAAPVFSGCGLA